MFDQKIKLRLRIFFIQNLPTFFVLLNFLTFSTVKIIVFFSIFPKIIINFVSFKQINNQLLIFVYYNNNYLL